VLFEASFDIGCVAGVVAAVFAEKHIHIVGHQQPTLDSSIVKLPTCYLGFNDAWKHSNVQNLVLSWNVDAYCSPTGASLSDQDNVKH
jgi:hypothetical protein